MRYYKYDLEYYYVGFIDSDVSESSSTTIAPESEEHIIWDPDLLVWITEVEDILTLDEEKEIKRLATIAYFEDIMNSIREDMADFEENTYRTQESEWREYVKDSSTLTPYIDRLAELRGIDRDTLMNKIGVNIISFADIQGQMYSLEDAIYSCTDIDQLNSIPYPWI